MLTSVGQRVDIARAFRAAGAVTLGVDADPLAPALYHCDHREIVPRIALPEYVPALARLENEYRSKGVSLVLIAQNATDSPADLRA